VYGNACDVDALQDIASNAGLPLIYDAAHAFGACVRGQSLLSYGDAATLSFHATKLFHTVEGGAIVFRSEEHLEEARRLINFGQEGVDDVPVVGLNAKLNEFQAAVGLCVLDELDAIMAGRRRVCEHYDALLGDAVERPRWHHNATRNYAYYPVLLDSEQRLNQIADRLARLDIYPRRYFYPALNTLATTLGSPPMPVAEDAAKRVLCLPLWPALGDGHVARIASVVRGA
jgi:dTDP-4-amino-4,6-dideoxygalactose transaminase